MLDHRLNCRTVYLNALHRYLYWNMNYHVEHHMFPLVPFHALPKLHELIKANSPPAYPGLVAAYREIIRAVLRQAVDPNYFVRRELPSRSPAAPPPAAVFSGAGEPLVDGWITVCPAALLLRGEVIRFDHEHATYAVYRRRR